MQWMPGKYYWELAMINITEFTDSKKDAFRTLNEEWLKKYFSVEQKDIELLSDPRKSIINKGGRIFFAERDGYIIGTVALIPLYGGGFELGKMAVTEKAQGLGVGALLMDACIAAAKQAGVKKLVLYSNTKLLPAIHLYRKFGFIEVPITESGYVRTNIKMELLLR